MGFVLVAVVVTSIDTVFSSTFLILFGSLRNLFQINYHRKNQANLGCSLLKTCTLKSLFQTRESHGMLEGFILRVNPLPPHCSSEVVLQSRSVTLWKHSVLGRLYVSICSIVGCGFSVQDSRLVNSQFCDCGQVASPIEVSVFLAVNGTKEIHPACFLKLSSAADRKAQRY